MAANEMMPEIRVSWPRLTAAPTCTMRRTITVLAALTTSACALGPGKSGCIMDTNVRVADYAPAELLLLVAAPDLDEEQLPYLSLTHGEEARTVAGELLPETDPAVLALVPPEHCEPATLRAFAIDTDPAYWKKFWSEARPDSGFEFGVGIPGLEESTELDMLGVALLARTGDELVLGCGCLNR